MISRGVEIISTYCINPSNVAKTGNVTGDSIANMARKPNKKQK